MKYFTKKTDDDRLYITDESFKYDSIHTVTVSSLVKNLKQIENFTIYINGIKHVQNLSLFPDKLEKGYICVSFYLGDLYNGWEEDGDIDEEDFYGCNFLISNLKGFEVVSYETKNEHYRKYLSNFLKSGLFYSPNEKEYLQFLRKK